ncbi:MAG: DUF2490 domain-containing protein [Bryobacterales bacterium]|nr:DUF2490 domain-containing protein [Bryobacterales bacterium]
MTIQLQYGLTPRYTELAPLALGCLLALWLPVFLRAQVETQHVFNFPWQVGEATEITLHGRFRTRPGGEGIYQGRTGAILQHDVGSHVGLIAGYYFAEQESGLADSEAWNRYFGGFDHKLFRWKGSWQARHVAEFFDAPGAVNYYRVRHRAGWAAPTRVAPFLNAEFLWDRSGWRSTRWQAGTAWRISPRVSVDVHYFYEPRRLDVGPAPRHMWGTTLRIPIGKTP